jgi:hypothetical protein
MAMQSHVKPQGSPGTQGGEGGGGNLVKILSVGGGGGGGISGFPVKILFMKCKVNTCQNQISCEGGREVGRATLDQTFLYAIAGGFVCTCEASVIISSEKRRLEMSGGQVVITTDIG